LKPEYASEKFGRGADALPKAGNEMLIAKTGTAAQLGDGLPIIGTMKPRQNKFDQGVNSLTIQLPHQHRFDNMNFFMITIREEQPIVKFGYPPSKNLVTFDYLVA
jgi:hypothetical protein